MDDNKIKWNELYKERTIKIYPPPIIEKKQLPKGVYLCPNCLGDGKEIDIHRMFGSHTYRKCHICNGIGEIKKCSICNINPIPNNDTIIRCISCYEIYSAKRKEDFLARLNNKLKQNKIKQNEVNL